MPFLEPRDLAAVVRAGFRSSFGRDAEVVGRAPGRVNLIGEHTDYNGGLCLPIALEHATWVAGAARDDATIRVVSDPVGSWEGTIDSPADVSGWAAYVAGVVWALREDGVDVPGFDLYVASDVPVGAGLSSSAALECAVAMVVAGGVDRERLRDACIRAETEVADAPTGGLDQTVALFATAGEALQLDFTDGSRTPRPFDTATAGLALLVMDTRVSHSLNDGSYGDRRAECDAAAAALGVPLRRACPEQVAALADPLLRRRATHVLSENARVEEAAAALGAGDWKSLGAVLSASHASLRDDFEVSCVELDTVCAAAEDAGALGARMTGGGFGGSAIALVETDRVETVRAHVDEVMRARGLTMPAYLLARPGAAADADPRP